MYTEFYKLTGRPFQLTPDPRFYYDSRTHKKAMAYLTYGLSQGEGFIVITGDIGAGKTTLVGLLLATLDPEHYIAAKVVSTQVGADDTLRLVASHLGINQEGLNKAALLRRLETFLLQAHQDGKRVVLVVDEAQNLPNSSLEELRMLSNFTCDEEALMQVFLVGQPQFRRRVTSDPDLEQVRQRIIATYHLQPMADPDETGAYILHRLNQVGWDNDPEITDDAIQRVHHFCGGIPRRINTLCSRLLLYGFLEELHVIDIDVVNAVIAELGAAEKSVSGAAEPQAYPLDNMSSDINPASEPDVPVPEALAQQDDVSLKELARRVATLEKYVLSHEDTLSKALDIAKDWLKAFPRPPGR